MIKCPCNGCTAETGRFPGCSADCYRYKEWKKEQVVIRDKNRMSRVIDDLSIEREARSKKRVQWDRRKHD